MYYVVNVILGIVINTRYSEEERLVYEVVLAQYYTENRPCENFCSDL